MVRSTYPRWMRPVVADAIRNGRIADPGPGQLVFKVRRIADWLGYRVDHEGSVNGNFVSQPYVGSFSAAGLARFCEALGLEVETRESPYSPRCVLHLFRNKK